MWGGHECIFVEMHIFIYMGVFICACDVLGCEPGC